MENKKEIKKIIDEMVMGKSVDNIGLSFEMLMFIVKYEFNDEEKRRDICKSINDLFVKSCSEHLKCCGELINARHGCEVEGPGYFLHIGCGQCGDWHEYATYTPYQFHMNGKTGEWKRVRNGEIIDSGKFRKRNKARKAI